MKMNEGTNAAEMPGIEELFNRHCIRVDERNRIVGGFSDAFEEPGETDILINGRGSRHFRLILDGKQSHENPWDLMFDENGIPLLMWDGKEIRERAEKDIRADVEAIPQPEDAAPAWEQIEGQIEGLKKTVGYVAKAVDIIANALPKAQQAQVMQAQEAMFGAPLMALMDAPEALNG